MNTAESRTAMNVPLKNPYVTLQTMKPAGLDTANQQSKTTEAIVLVMNMRFSLVK